VQVFAGQNEEPMNDAQKPDLFRLLAYRGIEGEAAYRHMKEASGVEATIFPASEPCST